MGVFQVLIFGALLIATVKSDICSEEQVSENDCVKENFKEFQKCLKEVENKRVKRQALCPFAASSAQPCQLQYNSCVSNCQNQLPCQQSCIPCQQQQIIPQPIVIDQQPVIPQQPIIPPIILPGPPIVTGERGSDVTNVVNSPAGHNITTVIHLNNIVNNTNILNLPTNLNTTNVNHINIINNRTSSVSTSPYMGERYSAEKSSCCTAVQPKSCRKSSTGTRCHHRRHKTCGKQCTSRIIHVQTRRKCQSSSACQRRRVHVPQPPPPRCIHTRRWPYVSCGGQYQSSCDGCYDHYGYGHDDYYDEDAHDSCGGCYDDGFDMPGPYYRRGPVLRPFYYHEPPCQITGECDNYYHTPYGYYGHDRVDPAFPEYEEHSHRGFDEYEEEYDDDEFDSYHPGPDNFEAFAEDDDNDESLGIETQKCKVVENDGSIVIRNCTVSGLQNPYVGAPIQYTQKSSNGKKKRKRNLTKRSHVEHTGKQRTNKKRFPEEDDKIDSFTDEAGDFVILE